MQLAVEGVHRSIIPICVSVSYVLSIVTVIN